MNVENINRILHANRAVLTVFSKGDVVWGDYFEIPKYTVNMNITIYKNVISNVSIYVNNILMKNVIKSGNHKLMVGFGAILSVGYTNSRKYNLHCNYPDIEKGLEVTDDMNIDISIYDPNDGEIA